MKGPGSIFFFLLFNCTAFDVFQKTLEKLLFRDQEKKFINPHQLR